MTRTSLKNPSSTIAGEAHLLLYCAHAPLTSEAKEAISGLVASDLDWDDVVRQATLHRLLPLLYWNLSRTCPQAVPQAILDRLRNHFQANARHSLFLTGILLKILDLFKSHGIAAIPYKGPVLAATLYDNIALREFTDLDILVDKADALKAKTVLIDQGYEPEYRLNRAQEAAYMAYDCEYNFASEARGNVEIHWQIVPSYMGFKVSFEQVWSRNTQTELAGRMVPCLPPELRMIILCVHGANHQYHRLHWLTCLSQLAQRHTELDWEWILQEARSRGALRMVFVSLLLARELLGTGLAEAVLRRIGTDPIAKTLAEEISRRILAGRVGAPGIWEMRRFRVRVQERLRDRVRCAHHLAMAPDWQLPLPPGFSFLYYPLRPFQFLVRRIGRLVTFLWNILSHIASAKVWHSFFSCCNKLAGSNNCN